VWDAGSGDLLAELPHGTSSFGVQGARWSQDGRRILSWSSNGVIRIWELPDNLLSREGSPDALLRMTMRHNLLVAGAIWNQDETRVLSWSTDDTARMWDVSQPNAASELFVLQHDRDVAGAMWNDAEDTVLTWTNGRSVQRWIVDVPALIQIGVGRAVDPLTTAERQAFFLPPVTPTPGVN
jgi:WD40 repeat protein